MRVQLPHTKQLSDSPLIYVLNLYATHLTDKITLYHSTEESSIYGSTIFGKNNKHTFVCFYLSNKFIQPPYSHTVTHTVAFSFLPFLNLFLLYYQNEVRVFFFLSTEMHFHVDIILLQRSKLSYSFTHTFCKTIMPSEQNQCRSLSLSEPLNNY